MLRRICLALGIAFLTAQLGAIGYARLSPARYFCWAPYDTINFYTLEVRMEGRLLREEEVARRYRLPSLGRDNRAIQHVIDVVRQYEQTYGQQDAAHVLLRYRTNGAKERVWQWPAP